MPARNRTDPCDELTDTERLRQIIVGAALQADHLVGLGVPGRQHQRRRIDVRSVGPDRATERHTVQPWQHHVEHEQIVRLCPCTFERMPSVSRLFHLVAGEPQMEAQQLPNRRIVFDDERAAWLAAHRPCRHSRMCGSPPPPPPP